MRPLNLSKPSFVISDKDKKWEQNVGNMGRSHKVTENSPRGGGGKVAESCNKRAQNGEIVSNKNSNQNIKKEKPNLQPSSDSKGKNMLLVNTLAVCPRTPSRAISKKK